LIPILSHNRSHSALAGAWFLNSGIQEATGGVARYYRSDIRENARVSTEITGYAINTLIHFYGRTGEPAFREAAQRAGNFLTQIAWSPRLATFPFEHSANGDAPQPLAYFFDCGIIARGLIMLSEATGKPEYLAIAAKAGRSMASDFYRSGVLHPVIDLPGKAPLPLTSQWSRRPGCYQLKSAAAWHRLAQATGDTQFAGWYESAVVQAIASKDSFLPGETPEKTMDRLHAYCYFLEGLLPLAGRSDCAGALVEGIDRISNYLRSIRPLFERSDVYAQLLRIRLFSNEFAGIPLNRAAAHDEVARMAEFQLDDDDRRIKGGFSFGRRGSKLLPYVNPVSTAFCAQALDMWNDFESGRPLDWRNLI
jgi:hypothetical protein